MLKSQFKLLKTRRFFPLFIVQFLGALNDNLFKSALVMLITFQLIQEIEKAQLLINLAGGLFILPFLLFSALAGQLADKMPRHHLVRWIKALEILFMMIGAFGFYFGQVTLLLMTLFLMGVHSTFFGPIKYSVLPDLLHKEEILMGNGLVEASTFMAILLGTILGTELGVTRHYALAAGIFAVIIAVLGWITSLFMPIVPAAAPNLSIRWNFLSEICQLVRQTYRNSLIFVIILVISWFWFMGFIFVTQFPVYVKTIIGGNAHVVTLFLVIFSIGIALGSLLCHRILKSTIDLHYAPWSILAMSLFSIDLCWASSGIGTLMFSDQGLGTFLSHFTGVRITVDLLLLSIAGGFYVVPLYAMLQVASAPEQRSRVIACNNFFGALGMVVAAVMAMLTLAVGLNTLHLFLLTAGINVLAGLGFWIFLNKHKQ